MYHPPGAEVLHSGVSEVQRCVKPGVQSRPRILSYRYVFHRITQFQVLFSRLSQWRLQRQGQCQGFLSQTSSPSRQNGITLYCIIMRKSEKSFDGMEKFIAILTATILCSFVIYFYSTKSSSWQWKTFNTGKKTDYFFKMPFLFCFLL